MPVNSQLSNTDINNINSHNNSIDVWLSFPIENVVATATCAGPIQQLPTYEISTFPLSESVNWTTAPRTGMTARITADDGTLRGYFRVRKPPISTRFYIEEIDDADQGLFTNVFTN